MVLNNKTNELTIALRRNTRAFICVALMSGLLNILTLTGSFFMLEVYDRVIPSRSIPTLMGLCILALFLFTAQGLLDALRGRILVRIGSSLDNDVGARVFGISVAAPLRGANTETAAQPVRDLEQIKSFLNSSGPAALFDLPWIPVYVSICFLFHPLIGAVAIGAALLLASTTLATELMTRGPALRAAVQAGRRQSIAESARRNAESIAAMGIERAICLKWQAAHYECSDAQHYTADIAGGLGAFSRACRVAIQAGVLALGACLVINNQASSGIIIAASILVARALAPAELAISNWRGFVAARQSWARLSMCLKTYPPNSEPIRLPTPSHSLSVESVTVISPSTSSIVVQDANFHLSSGQALGIIGPSGSGKSSLICSIVRVWDPVRGHVKLDGASLDQWSRDSLGRHIGYLPQECELFAGTIAENIARFDSEADADSIVVAAKAAGAHELILKLPQGYNSILGDYGAGLSAGQRQRIGLARALYGSPFLVVLDEPNANLDAEGEEALSEAISGVRRRGGICIVVAHRPSALAAIDLVLVMGDGQVRAFGPKDDVLQRVLRPVPGEFQNPQRKRA